MKKSILLMAVLIALVSLCLVFASCDSGSSDSGDPTPVTYTISFDANGGSGTMNSKIVEAGTSYKIPKNGFTEPKIPVGAVKGGANIPFVGWNTAADGTGTTYAVEGTIQATDITANITLYAQWAKPLFSVSSDKKVYFSKGNLYYNGSAFNFETNQYDMQNRWNENHVSHFRWAANSGTLDADVASAISTETSLSGNKKDVFFTNATATTTRSDFTVNGVSGKWRTLSKDEWVYLINTRTVNGGKKEGKSYQRATIKLNETTGVYGMIIYPDNYTAQTAATSYTSGEWTAMENVGCVFLPAAGYRDGSGVDGVGSGYYWSATPYDDNQAYCLYFNSSSACTGYYYRYYGRSVRLVCGVSEN